MLKELEEDGFDFIICDSPGSRRAPSGDVLRRYRSGGGEPGSVLGARFGPSAGAAVVQDAEKPSAVSGVDDFWLTRYNPTRVESGEMLSIKDVEEILGLNVLA